MMVRAQIYGPQILAMPRLLSYSASRTRYNGVHTLPLDSQPSDLPNLARLHGGVN